MVWSTFKSGNQKPLKTGLESININEYLDNAELFADEVHKAVDFDDTGTDVAEDYARTSSKEMQLGDTNLDIFDANIFSALNMRLPKTGANSIQNILKKADISSVEQITQMTDAELLSIPSFGAKSLDELKEKIGTSK